MRIVYTRDLNSLKFVPAGKCFGDGTYTPLPQSPYALIKGEEKKTKKEKSEHLSPDPKLKKKKRRINTLPRSSLSQQWRKGSHG